jgi:hypothetical protein
MATTFDLLFSHPPAVQKKNFPGRDKILSNGSPRHAREREL